jgi:hypothetical protein
MPSAEVNFVMTESDWKKYSARVPEWRDRHLDQRNRDLVELLQEPGKTPTERFWETRKRIESEARILRDCFDRHSRSNMKFALLLMLRHGVIEIDDLSDFSNELKEDLRRGTAAFD